MNRIKLGLIMIALIAGITRSAGQNLNRLVSLNITPSMDHLPIDMKASHYSNSNYFTGYSTSATWIGFLCKLDYKGDTLWLWKNTNFFSSGNAGLMPRSISLDKHDNITMVGYYNLPSTSDSIKIGKYLISASPFTGGSFIARFDSSGRVLKVQSYSGYINFNDVDVDENGNAYIIGNTRMAFTLGAYSIPKPSYVSGGTNSRDFLLSTDTSGNVRWTKPLGCLDLGKAAAGNEGGLHRISLSKGSTPRIFTSGFYLDSFVFDTNKFISQGKEDGLLVKFDLKGNYMASRSAGGSNLDAFYDVSANSNNLLSVSGMYRSAITINGKSYAVSGTWCQTLVLQLDTALNFKWVDTAGLGCGNYPHLTLDNYNRTCIVTGANGNGKEFLYFYDKSGKRTFSKSYKLTGSSSFGGLAPFAVSFPEKAPLNMYVIGAYKPSFTSDSKNVSCINTSLRDIALFKYEVPLPCTHSLGNDTGFCKSFSVSLNPKLSGAKYLWSTNDTTNLITINKGGKYWVRVSKDGCTATDTVMVFNDTILPLFKTLNDTFSCGIYAPKIRVPFNTSRSFLWWNKSTQKTVNAPYSGSAWIQYSNYCGNSRDSFSVTHLDVPDPHLGNDTTICINTNLRLYAGDSTWSNIWQDNNTTPYLTVHQGGDYWVRATNGCGTSSDTIHIGILYNPTITLPADTFFCGNTSIKINSKIVNAASFSWNTGAKTPSINIFSPGIYILNALNSCKKVADTININNYPFPSLLLPDDTFMCNNGMIQVHATVNSPIKWSTSDTMRNLQIKKAGKYHAIAANSCGKTTDSLIVYAQFTPAPKLGRDTLICGSALTLYLHAQTNANQFAWSNGGKDSFISVNTPGLHWVKATNKCGTGTDTIMVRLNNKPFVNLGNDTIMNKAFNLKLDAGNPGSRYRWSGKKSDTTRYVFASSPGSYSVRVSNECGITSDTINISFNTGISSLTKIISAVYPNPFSGFIKVDLTSPELILGIKVVNQLGQEVLLDTETINPSNTFNLSFLEPGTYLLKISLRDSSEIFIPIVKVKQ